MCYIPIQSHQEFVRKYINLKQGEHSPVPLLYLFTYKRQRIQGKKEKKKEQNYEHFTVDRRKQWRNGWRSKDLTCIYFFYG